jgi:hypothetical protein
MVEGANPMLTNALSLVLGINPMLTSGLFC